MSYPSVVNHLMDLYDINIDFDEDKVRYMAKTTIAGLPIIGDIYRSYDNMRYMQDYIDNRGLSWSDIKYPTRTQGMQSFGSTVNFMSKNILSLYV